MTRLQQRPIIGKPTPTSEWLEKSLSQTKIKAVDVARVMKIAPNMISIWRSGRQAIPTSRLAQLAKAVNADPLYVRNLRLNEEGWGTWELDEKVRQMLELTANELEFINIIRECGIDNPKMTEDDKQKFKEFLKTLKSGIQHQYVDEE